MEIHCCDDASSRRKTYAAMEASVHVDLWRLNGKVIQSIRKEVAEHSLLTHPILKDLTSERICLDRLKWIHLEYRHGIVQLFTDALLMALFQSRQLEPRLSPGAKLIPRFLLTLNVLDEFGFEPGSDLDGHYKGSHDKAHYPLFEKVLDDMSVTQSERIDFTPSTPSQKLNEYLQANYESYPVLLALLAVAEQQVITYSPALRAAVKHCGIDVSSGYYHVHGARDSVETNAFDDDHQDDLWWALRQACEPCDLQKVRDAVLTYLNLWQEFWDHCYQVAICLRTDARVA